MKQHDQLETKSVTTHHPLRAILLFALLPTATALGQQGAFD
jgi:hypothetical protein